MPPLLWLGDGFSHEGHFLPFLTKEKGVTLTQKPLGQAEPRQVTKHVGSYRFIFGVTEGSPGTWRNYKSHGHANK